MDLYGKKFLSICLAIIAALAGIMIVKFGYGHYLGDEAICVRSIRIGSFRSCGTKFGVFLAVVVIAELFIMDYIQSKYHGDA